MNLDFSRLQEWAGRDASLVIGSYVGYKVLTISSLPDYEKWHPDRNETVDGILHAALEAAKSVGLCVRSVRCGAPCSGRELVAICAVIAKYSHIEVLTIDTDLHSDAWEERGMKFLAGAMSLQHLELYVRYPDTLQYTGDHVLRLAQVHPNLRTIGGCKRQVTTQANAAIIRRHQRLDHIAACTYLGLGDCYREIAAYIS